MLWFESWINLIGTVLVINCSKYLYLEKELYSALISKTPLNDTEKDITKRKEQ